MQRKTQLVVTGYIFFQRRLLLVHHTKLILWLPVGDHDHCSLFYLCEAATDHVVLNDEIASVRWVTEDELSSFEIPQDVQAIGKEAFRLYRSLMLERDGKL